MIDATPARHGVRQPALPPSATTLATDLAVMRQLARRASAKHGYRVDRSDYESAGHEALARVYQALATGAVADRAGYLAQALENAMRTVSHRQIRGHGRNRLWRPVACDHPTLTRLSDARQPAASTVEAEVMVSEQLRRLDARTHALAIRLLLYGDTGREAARALGLSHTAVQKRLRRWRAAAETA
jgi:hypothetical protein